MKVINNCPFICGIAIVVGALVILFVQVIINLDGAVVLAMIFSAVQVSSLLFSTWRSLTSRCSRPFVVLGLIHERQFSVRAHRLVRWQRGGGGSVLSGRREVYVFELTMGKRERYAQINDCKLKSQHWHNGIQHENCTRTHRICTRAHTHTCVCACERMKEKHQHFSIRVFARFFGGSRIFLMVAFPLLHSFPSQPIISVFGSHMGLFPSSP